MRAATGEVRAAERYGIVSPRDGSIFRDDPDIPPTAQRITFEGERGAWRLDGRTLEVDALQRRAGGADELEPMPARPRRPTQPLAAADGFEALE